jgi:rhamnosyltransferase
VDNKICVGIVLYNPDIETLLESLNEVSKITSKIYLVDNHSNNIDIIERKKLPNVTLIKNSANFGIAKALNQILEIAYEDDNKYLITLDQDSILKSYMIENMMNYVQIKDVALICPIINDLNKSKNIVQAKKFIDVDRCITSGTLMILDECKAIGKFDEKMFIDYVDFDYCKRIKLFGKRIIRVNDAVINHEVGKRTKRKFLFWTVYPTNHNSGRVYYYARNIKYYLIKFKGQLTLREKINQHVFLVWKLVSILLYERDKTVKVKNFFKGINEAKKLVNNYEIVNNLFF